MNFSFFVGEIHFKQETY